MKLRTFAERIGVRYETAWRWFKAGKIKGQQLDKGTIIITEDIDQPAQPDVVVVVYARVSANENRPNLDTQAERLSAYCAAKGWTWTRCQFGTTVMRSTRLAVSGSSVDFTAHQTDVRSMLILTVLATSSEK
jgi:predicted site-specific integrase-resolvase